MLAEAIVRYCAPTMARLTTGNLFNCAFDTQGEMVDALRRVNRTLGAKGLRILPLRWRDGKALLYLFRPRQLARDLQDPQAQRLLRACGYQVSDANACVTQLARRLRRQAEFPHEIGLFLGYPPADVDGFMHRRDACKLCGLWKVYDDVEAAARQFRRCRHCTEVYCRCFAQGTTLDSLAVAG